MLCWVDKNHFFHQLFASVLLAFNIISSGHRGCLRSSDSVLADRLSWSLLIGWVRQHQVSIVILALLLTGVLAFLWRITYIEAYAHWLQARWLLLVQIVVVHTGGEINRRMILPISPRWNDFRLRLLLLLHVRLVLARLNLILRLGFYLNLVRVDQRGVWHLPNLHLQAYERPGWPSRVGHCLKELLYIVPVWHQSWLDRLRG